MSVFGPYARYYDLLYRDKDYAAEARFVADLVRAHAPRANRLLELGWAEWAEVALADLRRAHPDLRALVERLDVMRWGHAMVRPRPGFLWGGARGAAVQPYRGIHFAHCDLSGVALFSVGAVLSLFTGRGALFSGGRQLLIGAVAALITFALGKAIGVSTGV